MEEKSELSDEQPMDKMRSQVVKFKIKEYIHSSNNAKNTGTNKKKFVKKI
jgi:hypothetical protein